MKVVILDGSHNKAGMTVRLIENFIKGIKSVDPKANIKIYDLLNEKIEFCRGCNNCTEDKDPLNAKCTIDDVAVEIKKQALACDVLVFATPIYEFCVSSSMKRFLERCLTLVTFKFGITSRGKPIKGTQGVILCSSGAPFPFNYLMGITRYPKFILKLACKLFRCSETSMILAGGMRINKKMEQKWCDRARELGIKIAKKKIHR
jgi:FMN-dependent NADH-azoreductase